MRINREACSSWTFITESPWKTDRGLFQELTCDLESQGTKAPYVYKVDNFARLLKTREQSYCLYFFGINKDCFFFY